jgi:hypothetical protein
LAETQVGKTITKAAKLYDIRRPMAEKSDETNSESYNPLDEPGSWVCHRCSNHNFPSRNICHSKTCQERRPCGIMKPSKVIKIDKKRKNVMRHDPKTSKKLKWAEQADASKIAENQELRKRYSESGGEGMAQADIIRAKTLLERDERKRQKKEMNKRRKQNKQK